MQFNIQQMGLLFAFILSVHVVSRLRDRKVCPSSSKQEQQQQVYRFNDFPKKVCAM